MRTSPTRIAVLAFAGLALLTSACASKTGSGSGSGSGSGGSRSITVTSPSDGATVTSPVVLNLAVTGAQIGTPDTGKMHFHIYVDGSSKYTIAYTTRASVPVPAGKHTLKIVLAEPNHTETSTTTTLNVNVQGGSGGSPSPTSGGGGYGY